MTTASLAQVALYFAALTLASVPLGRFMARVYGMPVGRIERAIYRIAGVDSAREQSWKQYALSIFAFSALGLVAIALLARLQGALPLDPDHLGAVSWPVAINTAASFVSNTDWQAYGGETTLSYLTQMLGLTVQNFVSAATGMAVLVALTRGITRKQTDQIGNFWVDLTRTALFILLPLSFVLALVLVSLGVVQTFEGHVLAHGLESMQTIARGPVASQIAIKQLGTNGGGFFNANAAHPFEAPTALAGWIEMLAILLVPAALCFTFGELVKDRRQGSALFVAMLVLTVACALPTVALEQHGNPRLDALGVDRAASALQSGGNMEGKEVRNGVTSSALWAVVTTAASNGSVNSMHDSFTPLAGLFPMCLMQIGEVAFGGVGSGLYGMLLFVFVAVFIAGLMVGRTPEYLGKKIEAFEMQMASIGILVPTALILVTTAVACTTEVGRSALANPGAHGFSEILYAMSSTAANNGSAFGGLTVNGDFYALTHAANMSIARFGVIAVVLAIAGSLASKKSVPPSLGTMPTHTPLFVTLLVGTVVLVGALSFVPALALGPIVEQLQLGGS